MTLDREKVMEMTLDDLQNPNRIVEVFHLKQQVWIAANAAQAFQEYPGSVELWEQLADGRLVRIQRWLKRSVMVYAADDAENAARSRQPSPARRVNDD